MAKQGNVRSLDQVGSIPSCPSGRRPEQAALPRPSAVRRLRGPPDGASRRRCGRAYFTYVYCLWIFLSWLPSYLVEFRQFTLLKVGLLASLPLWAGVVGDTVGGLGTDWLLKKNGTTKF